MRLVIERRARNLEIKKKANEKKHDISVETTFLYTNARKEQYLEAAKIHYAASRLQGIVRGFLARLLCNELKQELRALKTIQRVMRGKIGRNKWMRHYWLAIAVVKSPEALKEIWNRSKLIREASQPGKLYQEMYDPLTEAFWYFERRMQRSMWKCPLIFQRNLICSWEGYHAFGGLPHQKRCRCVFDNVAEYHGHLRDAHRWYCPACDHCNSGAVFPMCGLCENSMGEAGESGEAALKASIADVHNKLTLFLVKYKSQDQNRNESYVIKNRLAELAIGRRNKKMNQMAQNESGFIPDDDEVGGPPTIIDTLVDESTVSKSRASSSHGQGVSKIPSKEEPKDVKLPVVRGASGKALSGQCSGWHLLHFANNSF